MRISSPFFISRSGDLFKRTRFVDAITNQPATNLIKMTDIADAERTPLLNDGQDLCYTPVFPSDDSVSNAKFNEVLHETIEAIGCNVFPERIYQGSSGSYFVKDRNGVRYFRCFNMFENFLNFLSFRL